MKKIFIILSAFSLTACGTIGEIASTPPPCSQTVADEQGFNIALLSFDTLLTSVDRLIAAKVIVPGSPRALQIADAIRSGKAGYLVARDARKVCNADNYLAGLTQAQVAIGNISSLIGRN